MTVIIREQSTVHLRGVVPSFCSFLFPVSWGKAVDCYRARVISGFILEGIAPEFCLMAFNHEVMWPNRPWDK
jgi:hypothetical protein